MGTTASAFTMVDQLPYAPDPTTEAIDALRRWPAGNLTIEFVHIHKCGGMTFNQVASSLVCNDATECLVRPPPNLASALSNWTQYPPPKFVSDRLERSAYEHPWTRQVLKAVMVRRPFERWVSEVEFGCRAQNHGQPPPLQSLQSWHRHSFRKNKIVEHLLPLRMAKDSIYTGNRLDAENFRAAQNAVYAFAFVGITEYYEQSMCLFARTFANHTICDWCCEDSHLPAVNRNNGEDDACGANYSTHDKREYSRVHAADYQLYAIALYTLQERWRKASAENWGGDTRALCDCSPMPVHLVDKRNEATRNGGSVDLSDIML